ncbi:MAG: glycosyltransferase [Terriglobia bacterium]
MRAMRVLVVGPQFPDSFARNVAVTLQAMGHTVATADAPKGRHHGNRYVNAFWQVGRSAIPALERAAYRGLIRKARSFGPDLVLVTHGRMPPQVVEELKAEVAPKVVCWFTDALDNLYRMYLIASPFDALFLKEPYLVRTLRDKLGRNTYYLPECCNPLWHRQIILSGEASREYRCDLCAMGSLHYYRAQMLEDFAGCDLKVWGRNCPPWLKSPVRELYANCYVAEYQKARAFLSTKIVLNTMMYSEIEGVNCALFEIAGCGAFQIADWKPALPELFEPEVEIVTFRTGQELKEKVDHYLAHPEERLQIAMRAHIRAHREHTYQIRLEKMFELLAPSPPVAAPTPELAFSCRS